MLQGWQKLAGVVILTAVGVHGLHQAIKTAPLPAPASRFIEYYEALEKSGSTNLPERILYSWILAGSRV